MFSFKPIYFVIFALVFVLTDADISDKRLCIDKECSEIISYGKAIIKYTSIDKYMLSFSPGDEVKVFSYGAGSNPELLGVEINGKRGYINKRHIKETRLLKKPLLEEDTELVKDKPEVPLKNIATEINADPTQKSFEVIDGTRIPLEPEILTTEEPTIAQNELIKEERTLPLLSVPEKKEEDQNQDLVKEIIEEKVTESGESTIDISEKVEKNDEGSSPRNVVEVSEPVETVESNLVSNDTEGTLKSNEAVINIAIEKTDSDSNQIQNTIISSQKIENLLDNTKLDDLLSEAVNLTHNVETENVQEIKNEGDVKENLDPKDVNSPPPSSAELIDEKSSNSEQNTETVNVELLSVTEEILAINQTATSQENNVELNKISEESEDNVNIVVTSTEIQQDTEPTENIADLVNEKSEEIIVNDTESKDSFGEIREVKTSTDIVELISSSSLEEVSEENKDNSVEDNFVLSTSTENLLDIELPPLLKTDTVTNNPMEISNDNQISLDGDFIPEFKDMDDINALGINQADIDLSSIYNTQGNEEYLNNIPSEQNIPTENVEVANEQTISNEEKITPATSDNEISSDENIKSDDDTYKTCEGSKHVLFSNDDDQYCVNSSQSTLTMAANVINTDLFLYLTTSAIAVIILVFGSILFDKCRREGPLIARINKLEQQLLTTLKENQMLQEKVIESDDQKTQLVVDSVPNEVVDELNEKLAKLANENQSLEEQIQALEKELDNSTEVGIELNKIITEMLNSTDGSEILKENMEQMQKKLLEQQDMITSNNETLTVKETENHELKLELDISNKKVADLQREVNKLVEDIVKLEEEKGQQNSSLQKEIVVYQTRYNDAAAKEETLNKVIQNLKHQIAELQRMVEVKVNEYNTLKLSLNEINSVKNSKDTLKTLLDVTEVKAQLEQVKSDNVKYAEQLNIERDANATYSNEIKALQQQINDFKDEYERAIKEKVETNTKLQVLNNYFKEKEEQMQKDLSKYESLWAAKEGEATSTTERIKYMQDELQNYKAQTESLKQEIVNQEVELKSQISMLEKKSHESWVANRQTERKLEEARQEAAQLRNRLTLRERALAEGNNQIRMQSPLQNGDLPVSPTPLDITQSPPPIFNTRDHLTKSPPIPGMPPFIPPPLGATPFMPPPPLEGMMPPFMPLPPGLFPGDHRPPPLGRMSSPPPVGGRYTPESTVYSEYDRYDRRSPSPIYDSEYGASPPSVHRAYSPYDDRHRDYPRSQARSNGRNSKGLHSSGSENDSLGKSNKKSHRKV